MIIKAEKIQFVKKFSKYQHTNIGRVLGGEINVGMLVFLKFLETSKGKNRTVVPSCPSGNVKI
jgi:hypothetical protein